MLVIDGLAPSMAAEPLSLDAEAAVARALRANKHLGAAELEVKRARVQLYWEGRLDNPEFELSAAGDSFGRAEGESSFEVAFVQKFPLTSRLRDAKALRRVGVALAQAEIDGRRRKLANEVRVACIEVAAAAREADLYRQLADLNDGIASFLVDAAARGEASPLEVAGARLAGKALQREAKASVAERRRWLGELRPLLGLGSDVALRIEGDLALPSGAPSRRFDRAAVLSRRPDHLTALMRGNVARAELVLARSSSLGDLAVRLFAERERSIDRPGGLEGNTLVGVGLSIPLPLRKRNEAAIESAEIGIRQSELDADAVALEIESEVAVALARRWSAFEVAGEASGEILELAEKNLEGYRQAYATGQAGFTEVQRAQEQQLELERSALELLREYQLADAAVTYAAAEDAFAWRSKETAKSSK